jgi:HEAT repeat protein
LPLKKCLAGLSDPSQSIADLRLADLSDLSPVEIELFQKAWGEVGVERRREAIDRLITLARGNARLNFDPILFICLSDSDDIVRARAIEGLWECEDCALITKLIEMLAMDKAEMVRIVAIIALGKFALLAELKKVHPRHITKMWDSLLKVIDDEKGKVEVKCRAIEAIAPLNIPQVKEVIRRAYESKNPKLKASALQAMGLNCDPMWLDLILRELNNPDLKMSLEAIKACGELGREEAVPCLLKLTQESNLQIQMAAIMALRQIGGNEAKYALYQCLRHPDRRVRIAAEEAWEAAL